MPKYQPCSDAECPYCTLDRADFCTALRRYLDTFNPKKRVTPAQQRVRWDELRCKCIPTAANAVTIAGRPGRMGMTMWQAVCYSNGIMSLDGGRFRDGEMLPTESDIHIALLYAGVSRPTTTA
jgi:hypothetical protein